MRIGWGNANVLNGGYVRVEKSPTKKDSNKGPPENCLKETSEATIETVCRDEEYFLETTGEIKEMETSHSKIRIVNTKNETVKVKLAEDPRKLVYFAHV